MEDNMKKDDCIFCKLANGDIPVNALYEDEDFKVIFDQGPASKGHVLILPKNHFDNIYDMDSEMAGKAFQLANKLAKPIVDTLQCQGLNILQNNGTVAGQTVFHFHIHMIPRYTDDKVNITWNQGSVTADEVQEMKDKIIKNITK